MVTLRVCVLGFLFTACFAQLPLETPEFDVFAAVKNRSIDLSSYTKDSGDDVLTDVACTTAVSLLVSSLEHFEITMGYRTHRLTLVRHPQDIIWHWPGFA